MEELLCYWFLSSWKSCSMISSYHHGRAALWLVPIIMEELLCDWFLPSWKSCSMIGSYNHGRAALWLFPIIMEELLYDCMVPIIMEELLYDFFLPSWKSCSMIVYYHHGRAALWLILTIMEELLLGLCILAVLSVSSLSLVSIKGGLFLVPGEQRISLSWTTWVTITVWRLRLWVSPFWRRLRLRLLLQILKYSNKKVCLINT